MAANEKLSALLELGQSVWYDDLSRDVLSTGELNSLIEAGVRGLTSNPSIFQKAITHSTLYDEEVKALASDGLSAAEICDRLMIADVGAAADLLLPIYTKSKGGDGYASIEVSPLLAGDTDSTVKEARRIWNKLNRPNIMIKVPGTKEGIPAVKTLLSEGINVNVTLIFSQNVYAEVAEAYISALEHRAARGEEIGQSASVASFFVSRVDAICEKRYDALIESGEGTKEKKDKFLGKVGIANSKLAYARFEEIFKDSRFAALKEKGAMVQRPLWASTGTKNPAFNPVLYAEELAGRDTVNTLPPKTLKILMESGVVEPRLHQGLDEARSTISFIGEIGLNLDELLAELQTAGVKAFADSYTSLIEAIKAEMGC